ncbi:hypothetical protein ASL20_09630 [Cupriavidus necator]|uniref:hypothetical protein n=1 Tax=Cupriavidus necator TaxID=106590 RepID=UPI00073525A4|nr:hypothetical protein [Cupriavidus necator]KUE88876.1 hypothetical protein ASL20_09630 [Cupriavidus necator]
MAYGVTHDGFVRKRLPEIRQEIVVDWEARLRAKGYEGPIETRPDSVMGLAIDTFAEREEALWELAEGVYYSMYPPTASGASLDNAVSFSGAKRQPDEPSRCYVVLYGEPGTVVPRGAQIRHRVTQTIWETAGNAVVSADEVADAQIGVMTLAPYAEYSIVVDGTAYGYQSGDDPRLSYVLSGIATALLATGLNVETTATRVRLFSDGRAAFSLSVSQNLGVDRLGTPVLAQTLGGMAELANVGDLSQIVTRINGWDGVNNLQPGSVGRAAENDADLRVSYAAGIFRLGAGTQPSIEDNLRERVSGVVDVRAFENDGDDPDQYGRPPHSIHAVVDGGLDDDIAQLLRRTKGGGIDTYGDELVVVVDEDGTHHEIRFDRSHRLYIWIKARIKLLPPEEHEFPGDGYERIQEGIVNVGNAFGIGGDVIMQKLYGGVYRTPGVSMAEVRIAASSDPAFVPADTDYAASNVEVKPFERAVFDTSRVKVDPWI